MGTQVYCTETIDVKVKKVPAVIVYVETCVALLEYYFLRKKMEAHELKV